MERTSDMTPPVNGPLNTCTQCGSAIAHVELHRQWHLTLDKNLASPPTPAGIDSSSLLSVTHRRVKTPTGFRLRCGLSFLNAHAWSDEPSEVTCGVCGE